MQLSVFIITRGRVGIFRRCLRSVLEHLPKDSEVRVLINGTDSQTEKYLSTITDSRLIWRTIAKEPRTRCRNRAFDDCQGKIIYFLDDDVIVPPHALELALRRFDENPSLGILGGPNLTPTDSGFLESVFGAMMCSPLIAPRVYRRYSPRERAFRMNANDSELILCNLAMRRELVPDSIRFRSRLVSNEENLFLHQCASHGMVIGWDPQIGVFHCRRNTVSGFVSQIHSYGVGRGQQTVIRPSSTHPLFFVPALSVVGFFVGLFFPSLLAMLLGWYGALMFCACLRCEEIRSTGPLGVLTSFALTPLLHFMYGVGFWRGVGSEFLHRVRATKVIPPEVPASQGSNIAYVDPARGS